ncbi:MAG: hypothetical protein M1813_002492 [Trichoglossum hirsutum]|nr:MAG: hypothetical protein M1813_002492 [Trichoglossum hirsutum]
MASSSSSEVAEPAQSYTTMDRGDVEAIGARCQFEYCNQLDFLPFRCESCRGKFCLDHRTEYAHKCPNEGAWATARRRKELGVTSAPDNSKQPLRSFLPESKCSYPQCKTIINTPRNTGVHCQTCNRMYCLKHRMLEEHDCSNLTPIGARPTSTAAFNAASQTEKARVAFARLKAWGREKQKDIKLPTAIAPKPSSNAARLIALNKLKKSAKGDDKIPVDNRVYLNVEAEAASTTSKFPRGEFFYNKEWSVGRVLDAAAKSLQVQNVNNRGGGEAERLRVFHVEGGRLLEFSEKVDAALVSGNTIVLLRGVGPSAPDLIQT